ncbi:MAG: PKD domain-containing protein [Planctomycetota bacterium]
MKTRIRRAALVCSVALVALLGAGPADAADEPSFTIQVTSVFYYGWYGYAGAWATSFTAEGDIEDSGTATITPRTVDGTVFHDLVLNGAHGTIEIEVEQDPTLGYPYVRRLGAFEIVGGTGSYADLEADGSSMVHESGAWGTGWTYTYPTKHFLLTSSGAEEPNEAPVASVQWVSGIQPPTAAPLYGYLYAHNSSDLDGLITKFEWDVDGDGIYETDTGYIAQLNHTFETGGTYEVTVRITDDDGATDTASVTVYVEGDEPEPVRIAYDGFESGLTGGSGDWLGVWNATGDVAIRVNRGGPHSGRAHVRLRRSTGYLERFVDLSGTRSVKLRLWAKVRSFETTDRAYLMVSPDGKIYTTLATFDPSDSDNTYHYYEFDLSAMDMTDDFRVAVQAAMNSKRDYLYLDDIEFFGIKE